MAILNFLPRSGSRRGIGRHGLPAVIGDARQGTVGGVFAPARDRPEAPCRHKRGLVTGPMTGPSTVDEAAVCAGRQSGLGRGACRQIQGDGGPVRMAQKGDGQRTRRQQADRERRGKSQGAPAFGREHAFCGIGGSSHAAIKDWDGYAPVNDLVSPTPSGLRGYVLWRSGSRRRACRAMLRPPPPCRGSRTKGTAGARPRGRSKPRSGATARPAWCRPAPWPRRPSSCRAAGPAHRRAGSRHTSCPAPA